MNTIYDFINERLIPNDYDETWEELPTSDYRYEKVKNIILQLTSSDENVRPSLMWIAKVKGQSYVIIEISGGNNGNNDWESYLEDMKNIVKNLKNCWIIDIKNDVSDDIWYMHIGCKL